MKKSDDFNNTASLTGFIFIILTVIYSTDTFDIWDLVISSTLLFLLLKYTNYFKKNNEIRLIFRIGFGICFGVFITSLLVLNFKTFNIETKFLEKPLFKILDIDFLISIVGFFVSFLLLKYKKN